MGRSFRASKQGTEKAKAAFKLKGWTQDHLAGRADCNRSVVINFFAKRPVEKGLFQAICNELDLEWGDVADPESEEELSKPSMDVAQGNTSKSTQELGNTTRVLTPVPVEESATRNTKAIFILSGTINSVDKAKLKAIEAHLRKISGDANLTITDVEPGSIKITLEGSSEGIEELIKLFESGQLNEVLGIAVEDVQLITDETSNDDESTEDEKPPTQINVIQKSRNQNQVTSSNPIGVKFILANLIRGNLDGAFRILKNLNAANLSGVNLSSADLRGADLRGADLRGANLSRANLNRADLRGANLRGADLRGADLSDTDLIYAYRIGANQHGVYLRGFGANLRDANLRDANLSAANLRVANLSDANLSAANLRDANLSGANLSAANLSAADLSAADLSVANLSAANLSGANLSDANLSAANLGGADFENAIVKNALFTKSIGLAEDVKRDLARRGAIFDDRPPVLAPK